MGYDVFMSFRGEDTRMGFTSHLYDALTRNDIKTYKDDKTLELGNPIAFELLEAIETSRIAIVVLSKEFATSKWCLEEIAKIVDCMKQGKLIVIPIFYHVDPSDVRHQIQCFEHAFSNLEKDPEISTEKVETWRDAFREVGAISGLHVTRHRDEVEVIGDIVRKILMDLPDAMSIDLPNSLVGIKSRVDEVKRILKTDSNEVLFIGICGMSGIGKTTLAEVVFHDIKSEFGESSFIENIKDISKQNDSTSLCKLQQKLLDDILKEKSVCVRSVKHGQTLLGTKLRGLKVNIVLDDVNHVDQLTYLAGGCDWFGPGTRIIVTTTNIDLLRMHKITDIYLCEEMKGDEALTLFCQSAFEQRHPACGYEKLSEDIVKLAGGLPLALSVYGSLLCGKDENYWKEMFKKLKEYPEKEVLGRLEVVFARLDRDQRNSFIYIACFLRGRNKELVKRILTDIGLYPECGITDLLNKCLITITLDDNVWMHDLLQQMCWEVLRKESDRFDRKHIAIKHQKDITDILSSSPKGMRTIEIINQVPYKGEEMPNLRSIDLSFSKALSEIPDLTSSSSLVKLKLEGCTNLRSLHKSVLLHKKLRYLNLIGCTSLESLGRDDMEMEALEALLVSGCSKLDYIPEFGKNMKRLELLYVDATRIKKLPENLGEMCELRSINACGSFLEVIPSSIHLLVKLRLLHISNCRLSFKMGSFLIHNLDRFSSRLRELDLSYCNLHSVPDGIGLLYNLITLNLSGNEFIVLPASIVLLSKLRMLYLDCCKRLQSLPKLSLVDDDMDYGPRSRFHYLVSTKRLHVSKFHALGDNNRPTVSCLSCPKLAMGTHGDWLVKKILNNYLQLRTKYWMTPEAVFEIVGAGSCGIPDGFVQPGPGGLILEGSWIGVAICALVSAHHDRSYMKTKYIVTAHIYLGGKHWKIPVPINHPMAMNATQLLFYWTTVDDLRRIVGSSQRTNFSVSFSVEAEDRDLLDVTNVCVRFIRKEHLKQREFEDGAVMGKGSGFMEQLEPDSHLFDCEDDMYLNEHICKIVAFCANYGRQQNSLDDIYKITKGVFESNQQFFSHLRIHEREVKNEMYVYCYYVISLGASRLYSDFIRSLKEVNERWLSVKLALEQMLIKSRADDYNHEEMLQHINDLEDTNSVGFSGNFMKMLLSICRKTYDFLISIKGEFSYQDQNLPETELPRKVLAKTSCITVASVICLMNVVLDDFEPRKHLNIDTSLSPRFVHLNIGTTLSRLVVDSDDFLPSKRMKKDSIVSSLFRDLSKFKDDYFTFDGVNFIIKKTRCNYELPISNFSGNGILLQQLINKMGRSSCFTKENEEEMLNVINKLQNNINKVSLTIQDMSSHAQQYTQDIETSKKYIGRFSGLSKYDNIISMLPLFNKS